MLKYTDSELEAEVMNDKALGYSRVAFVRDGETRTMVTFPLTMSGWREAEDMYANAVSDADAEGVVSICVCRNGKEKCVEHERMGV